MVITATASWLARWRGRHDRLVGDDFGDHGTAFGLDLSLRMADEVMLDTPRAAPLPRRPWWARWVWPGLRTG